MIYYFVENRIKRVNPHIKDMKFEYLKHKRHIYSNKNFDSCATEIFDVNILLNLLNLLKNESNKFQCVLNNTQISKNYWALQYSECDEEELNKLKNFTEFDQIQLIPNDVQIFHFCNDFEINMFINKLIPAEIADLIPNES